MWNKYKIVLLPTDKPTGIFTDKNGKLYFSKVSKVREYAEGRNLYILSDEEIKEGDWIYHSLDKEPIQYFKEKYNVVNNPATYGYKKIIATNNTALNITLIKDKFITLYCENPVDEVEIQVDVDEEWLKENPAFGGGHYEKPYYKMRLQDDKANVRFIGGWAKESGLSY